MKRINQTTQCRLFIFQQCAATIALPCLAYAYSLPSSIQTFIYWCHVISASDQGRNYNLDIHVLF